MSETLQSHVAAANLAQQDAQLAELVDFNAELHDATVTLSPDASIYPPEEIRLANTLITGHKTSILGELSLPAELERTIHAAIIKFAGVDGEPDTFGLGGISLDDQGRHLNANQIVRIEPNTPLLLGRSARGGAGDDTNLWPAGEGYGQLTSRKHVCIAITEQGIQITDTSMEGSHLRGKVRPVTESESSPATEALSAANEVAPVEAVETPVQPAAAEAVPADFADEVVSDDAVAAEVEQKEVAVEAARDSVDEALQPAQAPEPVDEAVGAEAYSSPSQARAMQELQERWGLPEDATIETAMSRLDSTFDALQRIQSQLGPQSNLGSMLPEFKQRLYNSLSERVVGFNINQVQSVSEQLALLTSTAQRALSDRETILTPQSRQQFDTSVLTLQRTLNTLYEVMPQPGFMNTDAVDSAWRLLSGGEIEQFPSVVGQTMLEIDRMRQDLVGYAAATESLKKGADEFVNDRIAELAVRLRGEGASETDVEEAVNIIQRHIGDDIDAHISGVTYPSRIVSDQQHKRKGGALKGQYAPSRQVAAEMAVDMIRGKFDMEMAPGDILLGSDGTVEDGQHRAAALMSLYGKDWVNKGKSYGFKINKR